MWAKRSQRPVEQRAGGAKMCPDYLQLHKLGSLTQKGPFSDVVSIALGRVQTWGGLWSTRRRRETHETRSSLEPSIHRES